jgi:hypothetical protein
LCLATDDISRPEVDDCEGKRRSATTTISNAPARCAIPAISLALEHAKEVRRLHDYGRNIILDQRIQLSIYSSAGT